MVRSLLLPQRLVSTFVSCGGLRTKRRRRIERYRQNNPNAPLPRSRPRRTIQQEQPTDTVTVTEEMQRLSLSQSPPSISEIQVRVEVGDNLGQEQSQISSPPQTQVDETTEVRLRPKRDRPTSSYPDEFLGWRKSTIDVTSDAPVTLSKVKHDKPLSYTML